MSDPHEKDRWRELADLLGLPPEENKPGEDKPAAAPSSPASRHEEREPEPPEMEPELPLRDSKPSHAELLGPNAIDIAPPPEPVAESFFEPAGFEEVMVTRVEEAEPPTSEAATYEAVEPEQGIAEEAPPERPRRGRRRGRRGLKDDAPERGNRASPRRAPDEEEPGQVREEAEDKNEAQPREARGEEPRAPRGRGAHRKPAEPRRRDDEERENEEEFLETTEEVERPEPAEDEDDNEEIDKLTDWNVPSWAELIGSLYRPER